jgi:mannose-6-phosphate isomerase
MDALYPLRFEPIFKPTIWGGHRLGELLNRSLPKTEPIGEAWVVSDQDASPSRVAEGPLQGMTLRQLMQRFGSRLVGPHVNGGRFPLLLKFLDARDTLSVQVHPDDRHTHLLPPGQRGKTEAWVVLHAEPSSRIYAGLKPGLGPDDLRRALRAGTVADCLGSFVPKPGDCFFLRAGTVHALGGGVVLFEVQQNSDVTYRFYDWDRIDAKTGQPRQLHIEESLACTDFAAGPCGPVEPTVENRGIRRERLVNCEHFTLTRLHGSRLFSVGATGRCHILIGLCGRAQLDGFSGSCALDPGDVLLLPAELGETSCRPSGPVTLLECELGN